MTDTVESAQELEHLTSSFAQLKQAQIKFNACAENVTQIAPVPPNPSEQSASASASRASLVRAVYHSHYSHPTGNTILVPLTTSLYVPGNLSDPEHVIVDVGTGYFVKKVSVLNYIIRTTLGILTAYHVPHVYRPGLKRSLTTRPRSIL